MNLQGFTIDFIDDVPCLYWKISSDADVSFFKESVNESVKIYLEKIAIRANLKIMIDLEEVFSDPSIDAGWITNEVMPELNFKHGVTTIAVVKAKNPLAQDMYKEFYDKNEQVHNLSDFDNKQDAISWLKSLDNETYKGSMDVYWDIR